MFIVILFLFILYWFGMIVLLCRRIVVRKIGVIFFIVYFLYMELIVLYMCLEELVVYFFEVFNIIVFGDVIFFIDNMFFFIFIVFENGVIKN